MSATAIKLDLDVPMPARKTGNGKRPLTPASAAIRQLAAGPLGASVLIPKGSYAFEPEGIRTACYQACRSGWFTMREVEGGHRVWKTAEAEVRENRTHMRGFASMDPARRTQVAKSGGAAVPAAKRTFSVNRELAAVAGSIGGSASRGGGRPRKIVEQA